MFQILNTLDQASEDYKTFSNEDCCNILSEENQNIRNDNGLNKIYYLKGKGDLHQEFYMNDGKKNGLYTDYYPSKMMDGKMVRKQVVSFKNDLEDGLYTQYWDGVNHAEWKMYEIEYNNGLKHGFYKKYAALINCSMVNNGQPFMHVEDNYKNGKKHGLCTLFLLSQPNVIANKEEYKDGEKISESDMHEASIIPGTPTKSNKKKTSKKSNNKKDKDVDKESSRKGERVRRYSSSSCSGTECIFPVLIIAFILFMFLSLFFTFATAAIISMVVSAILLFLPSSEK